MFAINGGIFALKCCTHDFAIDDEMMYVNFLTENHIATHVELETG